MKRITVWLLSLLALVLVAGCGGGGGSGNSTGTADATTLSSPYDAGPRAGEAPVAEALVERGKGLFKTKGCSACHAFGKRLTCPDLKGVTMRRTADWMEHQILHPEIMTKEDPISHKLLVEYVQQMPNQGLTQDEARAVIEFFKHQDHELGVIP
jgi:mono/diheme cytochrome c family protein